ncbi:MAG: ribbon-helix-helix protein, CopG family [Pyrodictiaceae archaeon]
MYRIVTFKIDEGLLDALDRYAKKERMTRSEVIREAIIRLLKSKGVKIAERRERREHGHRAPIIEIVV